MAKDKEIGTCEACPAIGELARLGNMKLCQDCYTKEIMAANERKTEPRTENEIPVPDDQPMNEVLRKAYIDKYNDAVLNMSHEQVRQKIADMQYYVKILNVQTQAMMDVDDEWMEKATDQQRAALREKDKKHPLNARPAMNADGTRKVKVASAPKEVIVGDVGDKAFENLVEKLLRTGMDRKTAENMIRGLKGKK